MEEPPRDLAERFETHAAKALELSEQLADAKPRDAAALYELGASVGLIASYRASVQGEILDALRAGRRAYDTHSRVLELDLERHDAGLIAGIYRYFVALLPWPVRLLAYFVGFDAGKAEGLQMLEAAAAYPSDSQAEARFALILMYNRERRYGEAKRILHLLQHHYPRNRLLWLEEGSTALRADQPDDAKAALMHGMAMLERDSRPRSFGEEALWHLKLGTAGVQLDEHEQARRDLDTARAREGHAWVQGRAWLELGKLADLAGDRARAPNTNARSLLCKAGNDRRCESEAKQLRRTPYTGT